MKIKTYLSATLIVLAAACSNTGVIPNGNGIYRVGMGDDSVGLGVSANTRRNLFAKARAYCEEKAMKTRIKTEAAKSRGFTWLKFECIKEAD